METDASADFYWFEHMYRVKMRFTKDRIKQNLGNEVAKLHNKYRLK